jgi:hypothetical protein
LGQADSIKKKPLLRANSLSLHLGVNSIQSSTLSQASFAELAPDLQALKKDFSSYTQFGTIQPATFYSAIFFGFVPSETKKNVSKRIEFRLGIIYQYNPSRELYFNRTDTIRQDTFSSSTTGMTIYKDSFSYHKYYFGYRGEKAGLDLTTTFQFNKHPRFRIYGGYNLCVFYSFYNKIEAGYSTYERKRRGFTMPRRYYDITETKHLKDNFLMSTSIAFGFVAPWYSGKKNTIYRGAFNVEVRFGITEDKIGTKNLSVKPWCLISGGLKFYRHRTSFKPR